MKVTGSCAVRKWEESTYDQISPEMKMTRASVEYEFTGGIEGKASVAYLMFYRHHDPTDQHKSSASYVGLIRFEGTLAGRSGSFVMKDEGTFDAGSADSTLRIAEGSGTELLQGITGTGTYQANQNGVRFELEYELG